MKVSSQDKRFIVTNYRGAWTNSTTISMDVALYYIFLLRFQ